MKFYVLDGNNNVLFDGTRRECKLFSRASKAKTRITQVLTETEIPEAFEEVFEGEEEEED